MEKITKYILPVLAGVFLILWLQECGRDPEVVEKIIEKRVEVPVVQNVFDTIVPDPKVIRIKEVDSTYYSEYLKLRDSIKKDSAYRDAITIREYDQKFEDTIQTINVFSKVRGSLLEQSVSYKTKPREIIYRDTLRVPRKGSFNLGAGVGLPLGDPSTSAPILKIEAMIINKKGNTFSVSADTKGTVWATKTIKIFK